MYGVLHSFSASKSCTLDLQELIIPLLVAAHPVGLKILPLDGRTNVTLPEQHVLL